MSEPLTGLDGISILLGIMSLLLMPIGCSLLGDNTVSPRTRDIGRAVLLASVAMMAAATIIGEFIQ